MGWSRSRVAVVPVVVVAGLLALNVTGIAPLPTGPLGDHQLPAHDPGGTSTLNYEPGVAALYMTALVENTGPLPVTIVRVTPVGVTVAGSVQIVGSMLFNSDDPSERLPGGLNRIMLGVQPDPGPGWASPQPATGVALEPKGPALHQGRAFLVRISPDPTQETAVLRFDVEYTVGPFHFLTTAWGPLGTTIVMCPRQRPMGSEDGCVAGGL